MYTVFLLHLGLLAQEQAGTKASFLFEGRGLLVLICSIRNGVATNYLSLVPRSCSIHE